MCSLQLNLDLTSILIVNSVYILHWSCHNVITASRFSRSVCRYIYNARKNFYQQKRLSIHNEISTTIVELSVQSSLNWYFSPCQNSPAATAGKQGHRMINQLFFKSHLSCFSLLLNRKYEYLTYKLFIHGERLQNKEWPFVL